MKENISYQYEFKEKPGKSTPGGRRAFLHYLVVASDHVISAKCEGVMIAWLKGPPGVKSGLKELSLDSHNPEGTLHSQDPCPRSAGGIRSRVLNATL
jgi:hypothetical protein